MPPKSYKVIDTWFKKKDKNGHPYSEWCKKLNDEEIQCIVCNKKIACISKGWQAVTQHENSSVHKEEAAVKLSKTQLLVSPRNIGVSCGIQSAVSLQEPKKSTVLDTGKSLQLCHSREEACKAELIWAMKMVQSNISTTFVEDITEVFKTMFTTIPQGFSLGRTKLTYLITEALGPFFRNVLIEDAKKSFYTLLFDETTNNAGKKELQFMIRFWSTEENEVVCKHLCSVYLGHATADIIVKEIEEVLSKHGLSIKKLIMISSDGPKVNKKVLKLMDEVMIENRGQGLVNIGTCNLHIANNSFQKGLEEYGEAACDLVVDLYNFFKKFPSRWEDFEAIQAKKDVPSHTLLKHSSTRWLTAGEACARVIEQWEAIIEYFLVFIPNKEKRLMKTPKYIRISNFVKSKDSLLMINFVIETSLVFQKFLKLFQSEQPLIHALHSELNSVLSTIKGRICKAGFKLNEDVQLEDLCAPLKIDCNESTKLCLKSLTETEQINACRKMQRNYMASCNYLLERCRNNILRQCQCLSPSNIHSSISITRVGKLAETFAFTGIDAINARDEWRILQAEIPAYEEATRIDHYWRKILCRKTSLGNLKYPTLGTLVPACLSLAHGNADVERGFSVSRRVHSEDKCRMSERVLNERLVIRDGLKKYASISDVTITKDLLKLALNAHKSYVDHVAEEKKKAELLKRQNIEKQELLLKEQAMKADLEEKKKSIKDLEVKALATSKDKKEVGKSALSLFKEANERLKQGIKDNDLNSVRVAQGMLEGAEKLREKEKEHEEKEEKLNRIVNKRKSNIIDVMMKRKKDLM